MNEWSGVVSAVGSHPAATPVSMVAAPLQAIPAEATTPVAGQDAAAAAYTGELVVAATSVYCLVVALLYYDTLASMVAIWLRSQTFAHGFLILPISLWLVWRRRDRLAALRVRPEMRALLLILAAGLVWLLARLVDVQVIQHLAFVTVLISGIWAIVGTAVARCYAFPLGFLFLAVPMGSGLIPLLMELTADTTEFLLRATGIPVYREGMYLHLPTGTWSVIEECSGVRYLIASLTLGVFYAHLTYRSYWRQAAFLVAAIVVPILANTIRAYSVVMVGHLSEMRFGIGADHLLYGWLLFGLAMLLMFWAGGFWRQSTLRPAVRQTLALPPMGNPTLSLVLGTGLALLCAASWSALALSMNRNAAPLAAELLVLPEAAGNWVTVDDGDWLWAPEQAGADRELDLHFVSATATGPVSLGLHVRQYLQQSQDAELVSNSEPWRPDRKTWRVLGQQSAVINPDRPTQVDEVEVALGNYRLLVWSWYRIDGSNTANPYMAKLLEAKQRLAEGRRQGARIFIATPLEGDGVRARQSLQDFVSTYQDFIDATLDRRAVDGETAHAGAGK